MKRLASIAMLAFLAACNTIDPPAGYGDPVPAPLNDTHVSVLDDNLRPWLLFHPPVLSRENDLLHVELPCRNATPENYQLEYRLLFRDAVGRELEPVMGWQHMHMSPRQTIRFKANALESSADDYRLEVRWAR